MIYQIHCSATDKGREAGVTKNSDKGGRAGHIAVTSFFNWPLCK